MAPTGCIFLLTDYGVADEFVGMLRASIARIAPEAPMVDLTHGIAPFDVTGGSRALVRSIDHLGPGVVLGVVDPGVGTARLGIALQVQPAGGGPRALVGPDNGLLVDAAERLGGVGTAVALPAPAGGAVTFDGRDVFAPVAARLWAGASVAEMGVPVDPAGLVRLPPPILEVAPGRIDAEVLWIDRFGNVQLAAGPRDLALAGLGAELWVGAGSGEVPARRVPTFAGAAGGFGVVQDANGQLAVVADRRSAAEALGVRPGDVVVLRGATDQGVAGDQGAIKQGAGERRKGEGS